MAVCLNYQAVYGRRRGIVISVRLQVIAALLLLVTLGAKVWIKIESTDAGYQLAKERQHAGELDMEKREIELHLSVLTRADNLAQMAKQRVGLAALRPAQATKLVVLPGARVKRK